MILSRDIVVAVTCNYPSLSLLDMYPVTLERSSLSSTEVGVWGPCLLCIQDASIVLYSEDGYSKLHHWSAGVVKRMTLEGDQLVLLASRYAVCSFPSISLYAYGF